MFNENDKKSMKIFTDNENLFEVVYNSDWEIIPKCMDTVITLKKEFPIKQTLSIACIAVHYYSGVNLSISKIVSNTIEQLKDCLEDILFEQIDIHNGILVYRGKNNGRLLKFYQKILRYDTNVLSATASCEAQYYVVMNDEMKYIVNSIKFIYSRDKKICH